MKTLFPGNMKQVSCNDDSLTEGLAGVTVDMEHSSSSANGMASSHSCWWTGEVIGTEAWVLTCGDTDPVVSRP